MTSKTTTFTFNNGASKNLNFPCTVNRNLYIDFDVINRNSAASTIVRFDVKVLMKESATAGASATPTAASPTPMTPNSGSGASPIGP